MTSEPPRTDRERHISEAMDWLLRLQDDPDNSDLQQRHRHWLDTSPDHGDAWKQARRTWQLLRAAPETSVEAAPASRPASRRRRLPLRIAALAVAACLLLAVAPSAILHWRADHITGTAANQTITLTDGSTVYLGADSALSTDFDAATRDLTLLRGEAFFDVTPDPGRPFVVHARDLDVTVVGTRFNVAIGGLSDTVSVASGKVKLEQARSSAPRLLGQLQPGEQMSLFHDGTVERSTVAIEDVASWRDNRLFVHDATVADVAATLQRYHQGHILLTDEALARKRVTGAYDLSVPDQALDNLIAAHQGRLLSLSPLLRIVTH
ncbi:Anti-FecI sigma factor, FecR [Alloalcanivorax dieselolei B5]|uniref:Anti-FecI sigma factor, FecR n=1 Tax=Alcanivorax dieselolei (strain DSM 16502 / CGMCC 1.3690 / MCCC 1A00001 / B-5) TaxID=930169 RepID=K0CDD6_ALCDB|nr:FecR domain-containing protein [Alloalcanivorax dieselolei]AFT69657.1 Anti-FecI sigma factor, FecR [Alloalcanivorax dieselolei B5]GGK03388.1 iron dicitrate transporter FecR [Alloalcanivorax dieselolei]